MSRATELLLEQLAKGITKKAISEQIGYSRPAVSRYLGGDYGAGIDRIEAAIMKRYERRQCPVDGEDKNPDHCLRVALRPRPHGFPDAETLWLACQTCPHKPVKPEESK